MAAPRVIVIGAGAAGLGAVEALVQHGVDFVVLEASGRTGGRVHAVPLEGGNLEPVIVELGANWIQGVGGGSWGPNPVWEWKRAYGLAVGRCPGSDQNDTDFAVRTDGAAPLAAPAREAALAAAVSCLTNLSATLDAAGRDLSVAAGFAACGWVPRGATDNALDWQASQSDTAIDDSVASLVANFPDPTYSFFGPDDYLVVDQNPRGYAKLLDDMVAAAAGDGRPLRDDERLVLNATVVTVDYSGGGVEVTLADGRVFRGDACVLTVPLGVLARNHSTLLRPPLRPEQAAAIERGPLM